VRRLAGDHRDMVAGLESRLAVDDDPFTRPQPRSDDRPQIADLRDRDGTDRDRSIGLDDIDIGAVRALLHGGRGDGQPVRQGFEQQPRVDQLAGPQPALLVWKDRLELKWPVVWLISLLTSSSLPRPSKVLLSWL